MKRSAGKPYLRSEGEFKLNTNRQYGMIEKEPSRINPIFTERPHYGIPEPKKGIQTLESFTEYVANKINQVSYSSSTSP